MRIPCGDPHLGKHGSWEAPAFRSSRWESRRDSHHARGTLHRWRSLRRRPREDRSGCASCVSRRGATEDDRLAVEEPLEIRVNGRAVAVTMRTPGHDEELALGFCLTEGLHPRAARLPDDLAANVVEVDAPDADLDRIQRSFYTSSSCGVCGKGALEAVAVEAPVVTSELRVTLARRRGAARADARRPGDVRPDRRAARDGAVRRRAASSTRARGRRAAQRDGQGDRLGAPARVCCPLDRHVLCVSGRLSFELVQKAAVAGCPVRRRGRRAVVARGRAGRRPRDHALRLRPRRSRDRLHARRDRSAHRPERAVASPAATADGQSSRPRGRARRPPRRAPARAAARGRGRARRDRSPGSPSADERERDHPVGHGEEVEPGVRDDARPAPVADVARRASRSSSSRRVGRGATPASAKHALTIRRFCMSGRQQAERLRPRPPPSRPRVSRRTARRRG